MNALAHLRTGLLAALLTMPVMLVRAQCPTLFDYYGNAVASPEWFSCSGGNFVLVVATPNTVGNFTINWGDGSPLHVGASLAPPQTVSHVYTAAVATYTITFTEVATGCVVTGTLTMEQSSSASIQIPVGGLTQVCAPHPVDFINSSTNVSPNTVFTWDFGDGSPILTFDHTNWMQTITHMYEQGTVNCETTVRLTAENRCNTLQGGPSFATFNPIRIWDIDDAAITPSATLLCWPDNEVTYLNTTDRNCFAQGNIFQRYEYWNFGDYWGTGQDSIIDWTPWPPTFPRTIAYPGIGVYEVMLLDSNFCGIDTAYVQIEIVPPPSVGLTATPMTICAGETVQFQQTTNGGANYFQWNFGTGNGFQWTAAGDQTFTYNTPGTYTVSYTASIQGATAGCADTASVTIQVLPSPTAAFVLDNDAACNELTVNFTNNSIDGVLHAWDFGNGTTSTAFDPPPAFYDTFGSYPVTLTVTNGQGCTSQSTEQVHVYQPPQIVIGAQNVCEGSPAQFNDLTVTEPGNPIIDWAWDFGDGNTSDLSSPAHLYAVPAAYVVTLTGTTPYCSGTGSLPVMVEARPVAAFTPSTVLGCSPLTVSFANASTGATGAVWTFGDGGGTTELEPTYTFHNYGNTDSVYTVQLVATTFFGCTDTATVQVTVAPGVQALFTHNGLPGCAPMQVDFTNNSTGGGSYLWDFGDGNTSTEQSPSHTYVNTTLMLQLNTVTLTATSPAGCSDVATMQVMVYPTQDLTFAVAPGSGCSPLTVTMPPIVGAVTYEWDLGDGTTASGAAPTHTYVNNGTDAQDFTVTLNGQNAFGCPGTATATVTVFPQPQVAVGLSAGSGCHPFTATLENQSTGATDFQWNYGDGQGSTTADATHTHVWNNFTGPGATTYGVVLTGTSVHGCTAAATAQVEVFPAVNAAFLAPEAGCAPLSAAFVNLSTGADTYLWDFGNGQASTEAAPGHTYQNQGLSNVTFAPTLVATSSFGCSATATANIVVHPQPVAQFIHGVDAGCQPLAVNFQDLSIGATSLTWVFGDGQELTTTPGNTAHAYANLGADPVVYSPTLIATSVHGCTDQTSSQVQVYPLVQAAFTLDTLGCSPVTVQPMDQSTGANSYLWSMGDGNLLTGAAPTYTYVNNTGADQVYTIGLTVTSPYGCTSTTTQDLHVYPVPVASFMATPFSQQFPNATVTIVNTSSPGSWSHAWDFGDGGTSTQQAPGAHTYATWGTYTIGLTVSGTHCTASAQQQVEIVPPLPTANFLGQGQGCVPLTVQFTNTSWEALSYQWNFGDGGTSTADNPVYVFNTPGTYTVTLTAVGVGGGTSTAVKVDSVVVHPRATAFFVLQPDEVIVPSQPVFTYNLSANASSYHWDMGDGTTYTEMNPVHYYTEGGTFDVTLVANNQWNCPDTFRLESAVTGKTAGTLVFPNAFTPNNNGPGDGLYDPMSFDNDIFFPLYDGVVEYRLEIFNRWGELLFVSEDVRRGWDGYYRGRPAKQDVYVYKARARFSDGRETMLRGDVTLLR